MFSDLHFPLKEVFYFGRMAVKIFSALLFLACIYLLAGVLFAIAFLTKGIKAVDPSAQGVSFGFKFLITPGCIALWPILLSKWIKAKSRE